MITQKYNIQMGNHCSAPCLWKAWHLTGPGHPLVLWILIPYVWNRHYNFFQWICGYWNLHKQYPVRWSDLSLCMAWYLRGQDIHSEDQINMHNTQIIVLIRVQMECWDYIKTISSWVISNRSGDGLTLTGPRHPQTQWRSYSHARNCN